MASNPSANPSSHSGKKFPWPAAAGTGVILLSGVVYFPAVNNVLGPTWALIIYDACVIASALAAAVLAARLWRAFERGETLSLIWGNMAIGLVMWAGGEIIWSSDQIWGGNSLPYPSMADVLWVLGYIPVIWALGVRLRTLRIRPDRWWQFAIFSTYGLAFIIAMVFIILPISTDPTTTRVFEKTVNLVYPTGDLIVAFLTTTLVMVLLGGTLFNSWGLIALGFLCAAVSDLLYAWTIWQGTFLVNPAEGFDIGSFIINLLYVAFYVLVAIGLHKQASMVNAT